jgi:Lamin Tail Domain
MKKVLIGAFAASLLTACNNPSPVTVGTPTTAVEFGNPQKGGITPVGILEVTLGDAQTSYSFKPLARAGLKAQDLVASSAVTFSTPANIVVNSAANPERLLSTTFTITANQAFSNLTLYALNQTASIGGTALKNIKTYDGTDLTSSNDANRVMPSHGFTTSGAFNSANADMQVFTAAELAALTGATAFGTPLEYGFVARRNANGDRAFVSGDTGTVTIAMRTPKLADTTTPWKFTMTFLIGDDTGLSRFTRSAQQTVTEILNQANAAAATGGKRLAVVGPHLEQDAAYSGFSGATPQRFAPVKVSTAPTYLQNFQNNLVISQVYGGGGNTGAVLLSDFIELFNRGQVPVNLSGLSLQYMAAGNSGAATGSTVLSGTIQPGGYFLVRQANGTNTSATPLPTPDQIGTLTLSGTAGKVALVSGTTSLSLCGGRTGCSATEASRILDFVSYGSTVTNYEGAAPGPGTTNAQSIVRAGNGCQDSNDNATDFSLINAAVATTRNSSSPTVTCP